MRHQARYGASSRHEVKVCDHPDAMFLPSTKVYVKSRPRNFSPE
jgi:hypothetical protein